MFKAITQLNFVQHNQRCRLDDHSLTAGINKCRLTSFITLRKDLKVLSSTKKCDFLSNSETGAGKTLHVIKTGPR